MLAGNDIVDLLDPENQPEAIHPRFDERVFTPTERRALREADRPHLIRWRMWAAKESAFKVARKLDSTVRFIPREFVVEIASDDRARVCHETARFHVGLSGPVDWVHAVATLERDRDGLPSGLVERVRNGKSAASDVHARVRELARSALGSLFSLAPAEIRIGVAGRVPFAAWKAQPLPVDISLSHHGRFVAFAWSPVDR